MWKTVWDVNLWSLLFRAQIRQSPAIRFGILGLRRCLSSYWLCLIFCVTFSDAKPVMAEILIQPTLPQLSQPQFSNDAPEEVLRSEIYTDANSPIDGTRLTAVEYTILMENLASVDYIPPEQKVSKKLRNVVELLKLRQQVRSIAPFLLR